ncbi:nitrogen regulatory protein P-II [Synergistales bacterium]|nr:nitrogen regulatory protein P-II [Synergistales bacterium]
MIGVAQNAQQGTDARKYPVMKMLAVVVDRMYTDKAINVLQEENILVHFISLAEGTVGREMAALLGLDSTDKSFICCVESEHRLKTLLRAVSDRVNLRKQGRGIAFIMPLSGMNTGLISMMTENRNEAGGENMDTEREKQPPKYELIMSIINQGFTEALMDAARAAGARGGTVLPGRSVGTGEEQSRFGMKIQLEKDIVQIITTPEKKKDIMRAISKTCGLSTDAQGLIFSLPIDDVEGINL